MPDTDLAADNTAEDNRQKSLPLRSSWSLHSSEIKIRKLTHGENDQVMSQKTAPLRVKKGSPNV